MNPNKQRDKTLKWIDLKDKKPNDGMIITGDPPEKEVVVPLAKIIPI